MTAGQLQAAIATAAEAHAADCPVCVSPLDTAPWAGCPVGRALDDALIRARHTRPAAAGVR